MTNHDLTRGNDRTMTLSDTLSARFSRKTTLGNRAQQVTQVSPPQNECFICGGYLPRRRQIAGLHQLCESYYNERGNQ